MAFVEVPGEVEQILRAFNFFYALEPGHFDIITRKAVQTMDLCLTGSPIELNQDAFSGTLWNTSHFLGFAHRITGWEKIPMAPWDYLEVKMPAGRDPFPLNYAGMSGGGGWTIALEELESGIFSSPHPLLVGVAIEQLEPKGGARQITLHGPRSIYNSIAKLI